MDNSATPIGHATMSPEMEGAANYYRWTFERIHHWLGQNVLDIGGGYGSHLEPILETGRSVVSVDLSETAVEHMRTRFAEHRRFEAICGDFLRPEVNDELAARRFDSVVCLNVLEHITDDSEALSGIHKILRGSKGFAVLQVPAHQWMYGRLDELAGHHRRYSAGGMTTLMRSTGFGNVSVSHFNRFGVLPWLINGHIFRPERIETRSVGVQVRIFDRYLVPLARLIDRAFPLPIGQSLIAAGRAGDCELAC